MKMLDLFAGLEGWSEPWREAGHEVFSVDYDPSFDVDLHADIFELKPWDLPWVPDVVLASPPCETFSVASIGHHWTGGHRVYEPKTEEARKGKELVAATWTLIAGLLALGAQHYVIENPRGVLRKLGIIPHDPVTVWYCHYGEDRGKPTDLWHNIGQWTASPVCHNQRPEHPEDCCCRDHVGARRGARTGTQGIQTYADRSKIPYALSKEIMNTLTSVPQEKRFRIDYRQGIIGGSK